MTSNSPRFARRKAARMARKRLNRSTMALTIGLLLASLSILWAPPLFQVVYFVVATVGVILWVTLWLAMRRPQRNQQKSSTNQFRATDRPY